LTLVHPQKGDHRGFFGQRALERRDSGSLSDRPYTSDSFRGARRRNISCNFIDAPQHALSIGWLGKQGRGIKLSQWFSLSLGESPGLFRLRASQSAQALRDAAGLTQA
jgi:hypothetical protein